MILQDTNGQITSQAHLACNIQGLILSHWNLVDMVSQGIQFQIVGAFYMTAVSSRTTKTSRPSPIISDFNGEASLSSSKSIAGLRFANRPRALRMPKRPASAADQKGLGKKQILCGEIIEFAQAEIILDGGIAIFALELNGFKPAAAHRASADYLVHHITFSL